MKLRFNYVLSVNPIWMGEYYDAEGIKHALEKRGNLVYLNALPVMDNGIRAENNIPLLADININFHSSFHKCRNADKNYLFYHEVHDKEDPEDVPFEVFRDYDGVFTPASKFAELCGINALQMAADTYYFHKTKLTKEEREKYSCDVVYIANMHKNRSNEEMKPYILPLKESGYKVHLYGGGWSEDIYGDSVKGSLPYSDAKKVYSAAKVGLNIVTENMKKWGLGTNRLYQMGACGLPSVSYKCPDYHYAYNSVVEWAETPEQFIEKTKLYLDDNKYRKQLGKAFQEITLKYHTWDHRIDKLLSIIDSPNSDYKQKAFRPNEFSITTPTCDLIIVIPSTNPLVEAKADLMAMSTMGHSQIRFDILTENASFRIDRVRRAIADKVFEKNLASYLLMIDDDIAPDPKALRYIIDDIVKHGWHIISGWYMQKILGTDRKEPLVYVDDGFGGHVRLTNLSGDKYIKASRVGAGFLCISRVVWGAFRAAKVPLFVDLVGVSESEPEVQQYGAVSEDYWFCDRARDLELEINVDTRCKCRHIKYEILE